MGIFTGLIIEVGRVRQIRRRDEGAFLVIEAGKVLQGTRIGDSISINGVDLTVIEMSPNSFSADASLETLRRSTLGELGIGDRVEPRASTCGGRAIGRAHGSGHVDGTGELVSVAREGNAYRMRFKFTRDLGRYIAMKGSITVDGISLTVAGLGDDWFEVAIIPHTWRETSLSDLRNGSRVNLEVDVLAKYVERLMLNPQSPAAESELTVEYLIEQGY